MTRHFIRVDGSLHPVAPTPIDLTELARAYDEQSRDTFLSLYVDFADRDHSDKLDARAESIRASLEGAETLAEFEASLKRARAEMHSARNKGASAGIAVFVSASRDFAKTHVLPDGIATQLVLDSSPYVRPLARFVDEREPFALALLDGERAAVYLVDADGAEKALASKMSLIGRHTKGGWSQMRYQRHRQGQVDKLYEEIASHLTRMLDSGEASRLILAGPGQAKTHLRERLPAHAKNAVIAEEDVDFKEASDDELVSRFSRLAMDEEAAESARALDAFRRELRKGEMAMAGAFDVVRAARDGRVALLMVLKDHKAGGAKCEAHQSYFEAGATCHACGEKGTQVDLLNEAVEHAVRSEARIEFVTDAPLIRAAGGLGALLRW